MSTLSLLITFFSGWAVFGFLGFVLGRMLKARNQTDLIEAAFKEGFIAGKQEAGAEIIYDLQAPSPITENK